MSVINKSVDLAILFLIGAVLIVPYAIQFATANWTGAGISSTVATGIVTILLVVFLFSQVKNNAGK